MTTLVDPAVSLATPSVLSQLRTSVVQLATRQPNRLLGESLGVAADLIHGHPQFPYDSLLERSSKVDFNLPGPAPAINPAHFSQMASSWQNLAAVRFEQSLPEDSDSLVAPGLPVLETQFYFGFDRAIWENAFRTLLAGVMDAVLTSDTIRLVNPLGYRVPWSHTSEEENNIRNFDIQSSDNIRDTGYRALFDPHPRSEARIFSCEDTPDMPERMRIQAHAFKVRPDQDTELAAVFRSARFPVLNYQDADQELQDIMQPGDFLILGLSLIYQSPSLLDDLFSSPSGAGPRQGAWPDLSLQNPASVQRSRRFHLAGSVRPHNLVVHGKNGILKGAQGAGYYDGAGIFSFPAAMRTVLGDEAGSVLMRSARDLVLPTGFLELIEGEAFNRRVGLLQQFA